MINGTTSGKKFKTSNPMTASVLYILVCANALNLNTYFWCRYKTFIQIQSSNTPRRFILNADLFLKQIRYHCVPDGVSDMIRVSIFVDKSNFPRCCVQTKDKWDRHLNIFSWILRNREYAKTRRVQESGCVFYNYKKSMYVFWMFSAAVLNGLLLKLEVLVKHILCTSFMLQALKCDTIIIIRKCK